jgi:transposase
MSDAERYASAAAGSGSEARASAVRRCLHALDNDGGLPLSIPQWYAGSGKSALHDRGGDRRRFYTQPPPFSCGIDLHARSMEVCLVTQDGDLRLHRNMPAAPAPFLTAVPPSRAGLVVAVACLCTWSWLADRWAHEGRPCGLGPALSMPALQGGQAKNDTSASPQRAARLRGGMLPQAYGSPAKRRATRDLVRRRTPLLHKRAERLAHGHHPKSHDHLPELGQKSADTATRAGVAERCPAAAGQKTRAVALALRTDDEALRKDLERSILTPTKPHEAQPLALLHTLPGRGKILRRGWLSALPQSDRFPRGQDCAASCRLVPCRTEAGGKRVRPAGKKIGTAPRTGALSEAATRFLRNTPQGPKLLRRLEKPPATGKALSIRAPTLGRAV